MLRFSRSTCRYRSIADDRAALRIRLRDLAGARVKYGYRRLHLLLQREGWEVNHKLVYRLYTEECLGFDVAARVVIGAVKLVKNALWLARSTRAGQWTLWRISCFRAVGFDCCR